VPPAAAGVSEVAPAAEPVLQAEEVKPKSEGTSEAWTESVIELMEAGLEGSEPAMERPETSQDRPERRRRRHRRGRRPDRRPVSESVSEPSDDLDIESDLELDLSEPEPEPLEGGVQSPEREAESPRGEEPRGAGRRRRGDQRRERSPERESAPWPAAAAEGSELDQLIVRPPAEEAARADSITERVAEEPDMEDMDDDADDDDADKVDKEGHRAIPSWEEALSVIINKNLESRTKRPNGGPSRGHGGRGR
jgi:hypothetical protein